jgi:multidrug resistance efflux pump
LSRTLPGGIDVCDWKKLQRARKCVRADPLQNWRSREVEVEQRALKVVRLESDLANAQVARAKTELAAQESQLAAGESTKDELETAKAALAQLAEAAQIAAAKRERAELDAAEANVRRQEKLLRLGSAHKSDVNRAQEKLAELKAPKD